MPAVVHHFAQPRSMGFGDADTNHGSAMRRFLAGQNVHRNSVIFFFFLKKNRVIYIPLQLLVQEQDAAGFLRL